VIESRLQLLLLALLALFHPITERWLAPWQITVDYPFLLLFWIAMRRGRTPGTFYGFFLGLLRDLADFSQLGAAALAFSVGGYAIGSLREKIDRENLAIRLLLLLLGYLLVQAVFILPRSGWSPGAAFLIWLRYALPGGFLNAAIYFLSLVVVWLVKEGLALLHEPVERR